MTDPDCFAALILGIGNPDRGDDGAGRLVASMLHTRVPAHVRVEDHDGEATALLAGMQRANRVWLIDAAQSGASPGTIHRIDCADVDAVVPGSPVSSHGFGVAEAVALARALGNLPPHCIVYAIEAENFAIGAALSPAVTRAAHDVVGRILSELATPPLPSSRYPLHPAPATDRR